MLYWLGCSIILLGSSIMTFEPTLTHTHRPEVSKKKSNVSVAPSTPALSKDAPPPSLQPASELYRPTAGETDGAHEGENGNTNIRRQGTLSSSS